MSDSKFKVEAEITKFHKNRKGDVIAVSLVVVGDDFKAIDVREKFCPPGAQEYRGTAKGICLGVRKIDELIDGLVKARAKALELGWLGDDGTRKAA